MQYPLTQPGVDLYLNKFTDGNPVGGIPASRDRAADMNLVYDELIAVVAAAGLTPSEASQTQVRDAILALIKGGDYKDSVRVASTAAINLAAPGANIDGVAMVAGDRFLEKDNATASARGIYIWNGSAVPATRALDADTGAELNGGAIIPVEEGTLNLDTNWQITNNGTVTIGTTGLTFQQIGATQSVASIQGAFKNLQVSATGLSANVTVTADEIAVEDAANSYKTLRAVNLTIAGTASGAANGLDTGALAINSWYSVWVIWNGTVVAGLLSLSATAPTLPAGYTHKARVSWIRTDASGNKYPLSYNQYGRRAQYKVAAGTNVTSMLQMASGVSGSIATPTWTAVAVGNFVPPTADTITLTICGTGDAGAGTAAAPNNGYGASSIGTTAQTNPPPLVLSNSDTASSSRCCVSGSFVLESSNIYYAGGRAGQSCMYAQGWTDNI